MNLNVNYSFFIPIIFIGIGVGICIYGYKEHTKGDKFTKKEVYSFIIGGTLAVISFIVMITLLINSIKNFFG